MLFRRHDRRRTLHTLVCTGMDTRTHARGRHRSLLRGFRRASERWQDLVADDVMFEGPVQHTRGKAEFVGLTVQFCRRNMKRGWWIGWLTPTG
jgi:hypothetical protein